jgi:hypothetical protein
MIGRYAAMNNHTARSKKTQSYYESHLLGRKQTKETSPEMDMNNTSTTKHFKR